MPSYSTLSGAPTVMKDVKCDAVADADRAERPLRRARFKARGAASDFGGALRLFAAARSAAAATALAAATRFSAAVGFFFAFFVVAAFFFAGIAFVFAW